MEPTTNYCSAWQSRVEELEALLSRLVAHESGPCYYDHHGTCQNHYGTCEHEGACNIDNCTPGGSCAVAAARKALGMALGEYERKTSSV